MKMIQNNKLFQYLLLQNAQSLFIESRRENDKFVFFKRVNEIANNWGGLPITHETLGGNIISNIRKEGLMNLEHGIYAFVGWHDSPRWIDPGFDAGYIIQLLVPHRYLNSDHMCPDDMFGTDGFSELLQEFPDILGAPVGFNMNFMPKSWIKRIISV